MRTRLICSLAVVLALTSACGDDATELTSQSADGGPAEGEDLRLVIETGGGFVPVEVNLASFPELVVANETVWTPGAQIAIFPPPAVPAVQSAPLTDEDLADISARIDQDAELFDGVDFGQPPVADLPSTTITVEQDGVERHLDVYALTDLTDTAGLTAEQVDARRAVSDLISDVRAIVDQPDRNWEVAMTPQIRVSAIPLDQPTDNGEGGDPVTWPEGVEEPSFAGPSSFGCVALSGAARDRVLEAASSANTLTTWQLPSGPHHIVLRPLFPGEPGCP